MHVARTCLSAFIVRILAGLCFRLAQHILHSTTFGHSIHFCRPIPDRQLGRSSIYTHSIHSTPASAPPLFAMAPAKIVIDTE